MTLSLASSSKFIYKSKQRKYQTSPLPSLKPTAKSYNQASNYACFSSPLFSKELQRLKRGFSPLLLLLSRSHSSWIRMNMMMVFSFSPSSSSSSSSSYFLEICEGVGCVGLGFKVEFLKIEVLEFWRI